MVMKDVAVPRRRLILDVLRFASDWIKEAAFEDSAAPLCKSGKVEGWGRQEEGKEKAETGEKGLGKNIMVSEFKRGNEPELNYLNILNVIG